MSSKSEYRQTQTSTRIIRGSEEELRGFVNSVLERAAADFSDPFEDSVQDKYGPAIVATFAQHISKLNSKNPAFRFRLLTDIQPENLEFVRRIIGTSGFEVRHLEGIKTKFAVTPTEYLSTTRSLENGLPDELIWSKSQELVDQMRNVFQNLWDSAIPAWQRIKNIEEGTRPAETKVIRGSQAVQSAVESFVRQAAIGSNLTRTSYVYSITDRRSPKRVQRLLELVGRITRENPNFRGRFITDIQRDNLEYVKKIIEAGVEVRHIEGNRIGFSVSSGEYLNDYQEMSEYAAKSSAPDSPPRHDQEEEPNALIWSNNPDLVMQMRDTFLILWDSATSSGARIKQIEEGLDEVEETKIITDVAESHGLILKMIEECKKEALVIIATEKTITTSLPLLERLAKLQSEKHFGVRILAPVSEDIEDRAGRRKLARILMGRSENEEREGVEWRKIERLNVTFFVFDRSRMFMTQYSDLEAERTEEEATLSNIYSSNRHTITGIVSIFEALWRESELVEKEISSRRRAELLQDILTHDIRNYNQVARLSAELIMEEAKDERVVRELSDSLLKAIDGSSQLVERAKKLGKILTEGAPNLYPVDVVSEIDSSFQLVQRAHPDKEIHHDLRIGGEADDPKMGGKTWPVSPTVLADDMLHEVFDNIYSNAVKYTDSREVNIETSVEDDSLNWKICICDQGRGIPEEQKNGAFTRYLKSAKGSGLGMSIVYALVVDRYGGRIKLKNRVSEDYTKGTLVEIWLPKHSPTT